ncbi:MAG: diguanylate cyclase, partial [Rhizobiales bacterium]|nr:diguanylate cyclase [Hyphomicrobiales bacterium]
MFEPNRPDNNHRLGLEDIADRDVFSRITLLASSMLGCPIALLSIIEDNGRSLFGQTGITIDEASIRAWFGAASANDAEPLLIEDAQADLCLKGTTLVAAAPFIRSCIGVPIRSDDGTVLGALFAMSPEPGAFRREQIAPLAMLGELAEQSIALHVRTRELGAANAELRNSSQMFRQAERAVNIGTWRIDIAANRLHWSDQVYAIAGVEPGQSVSTDDAIKFYQPEDRSMVMAALRNTMEHAKPFNVETSITRENGEQRRIRMVGERIDVDGRPDSVAGIILDCTEEHLRNVALKRAAERDRLTGLYNRASFDRRLAKAMQRAETDPVTVALLDLDGFKDVNDTLGHLVGDRVLETIAQQLKLKTATGVFLARWGGDEFAMLFPPAMSAGEINTFLDELLSEFGEIAPFGDGLIKIGATCGVAQMSSSATSEEIMRRADLALYRGKEQG